MGVPPRRRTFAARASGRSTPHRRSLHLVGRLPLGPPIPLEPHFDHPLRSSRNVRPKKKAVPSATDGRKAGLAPGPASNGAPWRVKKRSRRPRYPWKTQRLVRNRLEGRLRTREGIESGCTRTQAETKMRSLVRSRRDGEGRRLSPTVPPVRICDSGRRDEDRPESQQERAK